jgi:malonate transporter
MLGVLTSILPIFALIVLGNVLARRALAEAAFWKGAEWLTYHVLFPALLVETLCTAGAQGSLTQGSARTAIALVASTTLLAGALVVAARRLGDTPAAFTSVFQGAIRYNSYIFLAAAHALWGDPGTQLAAGIVAYMVMVTNALAVYVMCRHAQGGPMRWRGVARSFATNPIVASSAIGIALGLVGADLSVGGLDRLLSLLGEAAFALSLLAVGAGLRFAEVWPAWKPITAAAALKLVVFPVLVAVVAQAIGCDGTSWRVAVLYAAVPCASNSYILAAQMGGDARLMSAIVAVSTASAVVTIPLMISAL